MAETIRVGTENQILMGYAVGILNPNELPQGVLSDAISLTHPANRRGRNQKEIDDKLTKMGVMFEVVSYQEYRARAKEYFGDRERPVSSKGRAPYERSRRA